MNVTLDGLRALLDDPAGSFYRLSPDVQADLRRLAGTIREPSLFDAVEHATPCGQAVDKPARRIFKPSIAPRHNKKPRRTIGEDRKVFKLLLESL
jgi:hypothetical protein